VPCFAQSVHDNDSVGLVGCSSYDKSKLRLFSCCSEFNNLVNQCKWHIVDNEPANVFEVICGLGTTSTR
jgi:hypothetical protein